MAPTLRLGASGKTHFRKTKMCPALLEGGCRRGKSCTYAHTEDELVPAPDLSKTVMCVLYACTNTCSRGDQCKYAHGPEELRVTPLCYKSRQCWGWQAGNCTKGDTCTYAHGEEDRRPRQARRMLPPNLELPTLAEIAAARAAETEVTKALDSVQAATAETTSAAVIVTASKFEVPEVKPVWGAGGRRNERTDTGSTTASACTVREQGSFRADDLWNIIKTAAPAPAGAQDQ
eukprot:CAMPEP_0204353720 /NCGR_PEP_ID=MMETSP0469-20131031/32874_1 /ASSEMBLY_ACC=CAM_ASM_000384 /TAXON_ID=2969 /ORGANISM="Oxyrrhis marina" /LENGTH=231 /DNA_ID=CAMNT_0051340687 /DNA_START=18 /DNA_END=713 /DNA_ORIENTATION=+